MSDPTPEEIWKEAWGTFREIHGSQGADTTAAISVIARHLHAAVEAERQIRKLWLARTYLALMREGWEGGQSVAEFASNVFDECWNLGLETPDDVEAFVNRNAAIRAR